MPIKSIDEQLNETQVALDNALTHEEIAPMLAVFGYTAEKLNEGKALYEQAHTLHQTQKTEYAEQHGATQDVNAKWDTAHKEYMRLVKIGRVALQSNGLALEKLGLIGRRKESISGWLEQAFFFFNKALEDADILAAFGNFGVTQQRLEDGLALVEAVKLANTVQEKEKGEAQQSTINRDKAVDAIGQFMSDFRKIARIALEEKPQLLESLAIAQPS